MTFIHNIAARRLLHLIINFDDILDRVYSESAWYCALHTDAPVLTADNARLLEQRIAEGFDLLKTRLGGYVAFTNVNPNSDDENLYLALKFKRPFGDHERHTITLTNAVTALLAAYVLMRTYDDDEQGLYGTAWRNHNAEVITLLARIDFA